MSDGAILQFSDGRTANVRASATKIGQLLSAYPGCKIVEGGYDQILPDVQLEAGRTYVITLAKSSGDDKDKTAPTTSQHHLQIFNTRSWVIPGLHFFVDPTTLGVNKILKHVEDREYQLIHGHWQSGKSTHAEYSANVLKKHYTVIFIDFQAVKFKTEDGFWRSLTFQIIKRGATNLSIPGEDIDEQVRWLDSHESAEIQQKWDLFLTKSDKEVVMIADEFGALYINEAVAVGFFNAIRSYKNESKRTGGRCQLRSFIGFGTYDISRFATDPEQKVDMETEENIFHVSPFNMSIQDTVPHFAVGQTVALMLQAAKEYDFELDKRVPIDMHSRVGGHPGLTGECGDLMLQHAQNKENFTLRNWRVVADTLVVNTLNSLTMKHILRSLTGESDLSRKARAVAPTYLRHESPLPRGKSIEMKEVVTYLLAIGVFVQHASGELEFSSPLMRRLLIEHLEHRVRVSPDLQKIFTVSYSKLDVLSLVVTCISHFRHNALSNPLNHTIVGNICENALHYEFFHVARAILDAREALLDRLDERNVSAFEIWTEVKEKTQLEDDDCTSLKRSDIIITADKNSLIEIKANTDDLSKAAEQALDYAAYYSEDIQPFVLAFSNVDVSDNHIKTEQAYHVEDQSVPIIVVCYNADFTGVTVRCFHPEYKISESLTLVPVLPQDIADAEAVEAEAEVEAAKAKAAAESKAAKAQAKAKTGATETEATKPKPKPKSKRAVDDDGDYVMSTNVSVRGKGRK